VRAPSFATPAAIVIAGALVGAGVYFGGRRGAETPPRDSPSAPAPALDPPRASPPAPPPVAPLPADKARVAADAAAALDEQRATLVEKCWAPSARAQPTPPSMKLTYNFTFDAQGNQLARGVTLDRATARADVTSCLNGAVLPIHVPPPGASVAVDVPFALP